MFIEITSREDGMKRLVNTGWIAFVREDGQIFLAEPTGNYPRRIECEESYEKIKEKIRGYKEMPPFEDLCEETKRKLNRWR